MTNRKFYKTIIQVEVLSEEPLEFDNLANIHYDITQGGCSGKYEATHAEILDGKQCADALIEQGSDPEFFQIDADGNDIEEAS